MINLLAIAFIELPYFIKLVNMLDGSDNSYGIVGLQQLQRPFKNIQRRIDRVKDILHIEVHMLKFRMAVVNKLLRTYNLGLVYSKIARSVGWRG